MPIFLRYIALIIIKMPHSYNIICHCYIFDRSIMKVNTMRDVVPKLIFPSLQNIQNRNGEIMIKSPTINLR